MPYLALVALDATKTGSVEEANKELRLWIRGSFQHALMISYLPLYICYINVR